MGLKQMKSKTFIANNFQQLKKGNFYPMIMSPDDISEVTLTGFGWDNTYNLFINGWQFNMDSASNAAHLQTFCSGTLSYEEKNGVSKVILKCVDLAATLRIKETQPNWLPIPNYVIYEYVDKMFLTAMIENYLRVNPEIIKQLNQYYFNNEGQQIFETPEQVTEKFFQGIISLQVKGGFLFGRAAQLPSDSLKRMVHIKMQDELGSDLYLDPGFYHKHWASYFANDGQDLEQHTLRDKLTRYFAGPKSNGQVRFVKKSGGISGDFKDPSRPANTITAAVQACDPHDTVLILDTSIYQEGSEIVIAKPISVTSTSNTASAITGSSGSFPVVDGQSQHRVFHIEVAVDAQTSITSLSHMEIKGGFIDPAADNEGGEAPHLGGGVLIHETDKTFIGNCFIHNNRVKGVGLDPDSLESVYYKEHTGENGFGGGICTFHSSAYIGGNFIFRNHSTHRGGGLAIFGYGWPVVANNFVSENAADLGGRMDGGGIATEIAFPSIFSDFWSIVVNYAESDQEGTNIVEDLWNKNDLAEAKMNNIVFINNEITKNVAKEDGGGLYLSVMSNALFKNNEISENEADNDGGGIRASMGSDLLCIKDNIHHNVSNAINSPSNASGGGGISIRNISFDLRGVHVYLNTARGWAGGGVLCISRAPGMIGFGQSYAPVLEHLFGVNEYYWELTQTTQIDENESTWIQGQAKDHRKGAGVYMLRVAETNPTTSRPNGLPVQTYIEDMRLIVNNKQTNPLNAVSAPQPTVNFREFYYEDMVHRKNNPIHDGNKGPFLNVNAFTYISN